MTQEEGRGVYEHCVLGVMDASRPCSINTDLPFCWLGLVSSFLPFSSLSDMGSFCTAVTPKVFLILRTEGMDVLSLFIFIPSALFNDETYQPGLVFRCQ